MKRIASIDPGYSRTAVIIAEDTGGPPLKLVLSRMFRPGHDVLRAVPIQVRGYMGRALFRNGEPIMRTHDRDVDDDDAERVGAEVAALLVFHGVASLRIERVFKMYIPKDAGAAEITSRVEANRKTDLVRAGISRHCKAAGIEIEDVIRRDWASKLARYARAINQPLARIKGRGVALDPLLAIYFPGVQANADMRDAAGMMLAGVLPEPVKAKRKRAANAGKGRPPKSNAAPCAVCGVAWEPHPVVAEDGHRFRAMGRAKLESLAKRAAARCVCPVRRGRHPWPCPLAKLKPWRLPPAPARKSRDGARGCTVCGEPGHNSRRHARDAATQAAILQRRAEVWQ